MTTTPTSATVPVCCGMPGAPVTAAPSGLLPPVNPETAPAEETLTQLYGWEFSVFAKELWGEDARLPWPQAVARLRDGIRVHVWCTDPAPDQDPPATPPGAPRRVRRPPGGTVKHAIVIHPDGSLTLSDHPEATDPAGGHTDHLDLDAEMFLHSLGANTPPCVKVALWLLGEQRNPAQAGALAAALGFAQSTWRSNYRLRSLYAAVAWAQPRPGTDGTDVVWPTGAWPRFLNAGTTPRVLGYWLQQGWTVEAALLFLNRRAAFEVAEAWRAAGDTSARAAKLAGLGETPETEQPWLAVGFAPAESDPWRTFDHPARKFTPEQAWEWHRHGVVPNTVKDFEALPATEADADARIHTARTAPGSARTRAVRSRPVPTLTKALEWTAAGVPSDLVLSWYRTLGDDLPTVLTWCRHVPAGEYATIAAWNTAHPDTPLTPGQVRRLTRIGMPYDGDLMGRTMLAGLTTEDLLRPLDMLVHGKRWLGIEARHVLAAAITAGATQDAARAHARWKTLSEAVEAGQWGRLVWDLRNLYLKSPLWTVYVDWLATRPTPPVLPRRR